MNVKINIHLRDLILSKSSPVALEINSSSEPNLMRLRAFFKLVLLEPSRSPSR